MKTARNLNTLKQGNTTLIAVDTDTAFKKIRTRKEGKEVGLQIEKIKQIIGV